MKTFLTLAVAIGLIASIGCSSGSTTTKTSATTASTGTK
jgi:hypothetical protein